MEGGKDCNTFPSADSYNTPPRFQIRRAQVEEGKQETARRNIFNMIMAQGPAAGYGYSSAYLDDPVALPPPDRPLPDRPYAKQWYTRRGRRGDTHRRTQPTASISSSSAGSSASTTSTSFLTTADYSSSNNNDNNDNIDYDPAWESASSPVIHHHHHHHHQPRPDSTILPLSPPLQRPLALDRQNFHALVRRGNVVQYWLAVEVVLRGLPGQRAVPRGHWDKLVTMARDVAMGREGAGRQLVTGWCRVDEPLG